MPPLKLPLRHVATWQMACKLDKVPLKSEDKQLTWIAWEPQIRSVRHRHMDLKNGYSYTVTAGCSTIRFPTLSFSNPTCGDLCEVIEHNAQPHKQTVVHFRVLVYDLTL